jgi:hypothetical protein
LKGGIDLFCCLWFWKLKNSDIKLSCGNGDPWNKKNESQNEGKQKTWQENPGVCDMEIQNVSDV